jgi:hypothetical protein
MYEFEQTEIGWRIYWGPPPKRSLQAPANDKIIAEPSITGPSPFSLAKPEWQGEPATWLG